MGLFDSYKQTNSQGVRQFAGSRYPELAAAKKELDERYSKNREFMLSTRESLSTVPVLDQDRDALYQLQEEADTKLNEWSARGDLENATNDVYNLASNVGIKLKGLSNRQKTVNDFEAGMEKAGYDPKIKKMYLDQMKSVGPAEFDKYGRLVNPIVTPNPAKQVNNLEKIKKAVFDAVQPDSRGLLTQNGVDYNTIEFDPPFVDPADGKTKVKIKNSGTLLEIDAAKLQNAMETALAGDPEWRASIKQDAQAEAWDRLSGQPDEVLAKRLELSMDPADLAAKQLVEKGIPLRDAFKQAYETVEEENIKHNLREYAGVGAYKRVERTTSTEPGSQNVRLEAAQREREKADAEARAKSEENNKINELIFNANGPTTNFGADKAELFSKASTETGEILRSAEEKLNSLNAAYTNASPAERANLDLEIAQTKQALEYNKSRKTYLDNARRSQVDALIKERTGRSTDEYLQKQSQSFADMFKSAGIDPNTKVTVTVIDDVARSKLPLKGRYPYLRSDTESKWATQEMSYNDLGKLFTEGIVLQKGKLTTGTEDEQTQVSGINFKVGNKTYQVGLKKAGAVKSKLEKFASTLETISKEADKVPITSVQTTAVSVPKVKADGLKDLLPSGTFFDASYTTNISEDAKANVDMSSLSPSYYIPEIDALYVTGKTKDGGSWNGIVKMATNLYEDYGPLSRNSPSGVDDEYGNFVSTGRMPKYYEVLSSFAGAPLTTHPLDPSRKLEKDGRAIGVIRGGSTGTFSLAYVDKEGQPEILPSGSVAYVPWLRPEKFYARVAELQRGGLTQTAAVSQATKEIQDKPDPAFNLSLFEVSSALDKL